MEKQLTKKELTKMFRKGKRFQTSNGKIYTVVKKSTLDYYHWVYFDDAAINTYDGKPIAVLHMCYSADKPLN